MDRPHATRPGGGAARPRLSICIPTWQRAALLAEAIESALAQDYPDLEVVIGDNASGDATEALCRRHAADPRVRYYRSERNVGATANVRSLVRQYATGDYALVLSDDDRLCDPGYLSRAAALIASRPDDPPVLVFANMIAWSEELRQLGRPTDFRLPPILPGKVLFERWWQSLGGDTVFIPFLTCLFHRRTADALFAFDDDVMAGDTMLWWKLLLLGDAGFVDTTAGLYRIHPGNDTSTATLRRHLPNLRMFVEPARIAAAAGLDLRWLRAWKFRMADAFLGTIGPDAVRRAFAASDIHLALMALYQRAHEQGLTAAAEQAEEERLLAQAVERLLRQAGDAAPGAAPGPATAPVPAPAPAGSDRAP